MITLYHHPMLPQCRRIRLLLAEREQPFQLELHPFWERSEVILRLNPSGTFPILIDEEGEAICGARPIAEYLEEMYDAPSHLPQIPPQKGDTPVFRANQTIFLNGQGAIERAEIRRLVDWFDDKFTPEVMEYIAGEKIYRRLARQGEPNPSFIKIGGQNLAIHLKYLTYLLNKREWLAGNHMSVADFAAASNLSILDYLGEVPWHSFPHVKNWYANLKHRPSFRPILNDRLPGFPPAKDYTNLDF